jgi:cell division transport system permease protein
VSLPLIGPVSRYLRGHGLADRLVPPGGSSRRSLVVLSGLLAFLAVLAMALGLAAQGMAAGWQGELGSEATLQVFAPEDEVETQARAALEVLRATAGVISVRVIEIEEQRALLEPWIGAQVAGDSLPLPLLIAVATDRALLDPDALALRLAETAPGAVFDDHGAWRMPLIAAAESLRNFALALVLALALAMGALAGLAASARIALNAQVADTLKLLGARDSTVSRAFSRGPVLSVLAGAAVGTGLAAGLLAFLPPSGEQGFFLSGIGLRGWQWALPLAVPLVAAAISWMAARRAVRRHLRRAR